MKAMLQIGITGGIGAGKSLVAKIFHLLGAPVYDADSNAKRLMNTDAVLIAQIKKTFGDEAYFPEGMINRAYLSAAAFKQEKVEVLNKLVHPSVALDYERWVSEQASFPYVVKEAALLFESGSYSALDKIIVVTAPEDLRVERVLRRDPQRTDADVRAIIRKQMPEDAKVQRADYVICNDEETMVIPQVIALHEQFLEGR